MSEPRQTLDREPADSMPLQLFVCESSATFRNARPATDKQVIEAAKQYAVSRLAGESLEAKNPGVLSDYLVVHFAGKEREIFLPVPE